VRLAAARVALAVALCAGAAPAGATWSIVAVDPETGEAGAAAASCTADVDQIASVVAGRGAVVSQAVMNPRALEAAAARLASGAAAAEVLDAITAPDFDPQRWWSWLSGRETRQYGVTVRDQTPGAVAFTGLRTVAWSGGLQGDHVSVQGNMLRGPEVVADALAAFEAASACDLPERLLAALEAGAAAGGDRRCSRRIGGALSAYLEVAGARGEPRLRLTAGGDRELHALGSLWHLLLPVDDEELSDPIVPLREELRAWRESHPPRRAACPPRADA
jgi:uncharacterized Ntn-hydrolase superfamily protein